MIATGSPAGAGWSMGDMSVRSRIIGRVIAAYLAADVWYGRAGLRRSPGRRPRRAELYIQLDDPYSYLMTQVLPALGQRYNIEIIIYSVHDPRPEVTSEPALAECYAQADARELARFYALEPPAQAGPDGMHMDVDMPRRANVLLLCELDSKKTLRLVRALGAAIVARDEQALAPARGRGCRSRRSRPSGTAGAVRPVRPVRPARPARPARPHRSNRRRARRPLSPARGARSLPWRHDPLWRCLVLGDRSVVPSRGTAIPGHRCRVSQRAGRAPGCRAAASRRGYHRAGALSLVPQPVFVSGRGTRRVHCTSPRSFRLGEYVA